MHEGQVKTVSGDPMSAVLEPALKVGAMCGKSSNQPCCAHAKTQIEEVTYQHHAMYSMTLSFTMHESTGCHIRYRCLDSASYFTLYPCCPKYTPGPEQSVNQKLTDYIGGAGFVVGGTIGILTSPTPLLFATFSSLQWFVLGSTFWGTRSSILQAWTPVHQTPNDLIKASTLAGGITGGVVAALTRGRRNVLPGMLMFSLGGFAGQWVHNAWAASNMRREQAAGESTGSILGGMGGKGWSLMKVMNDEEYAERLKNQQLAVDAEISVLEDKIAALRKQQELETTNPEPNSTGP
jgi:hypothetical protein